MIAVDCRYIRERVSGALTYIEALVEHLPALGPEQTFLFIRHPRARSPLSRAPNVREVTFPHVPCGPATLWGMPWLLDLQGVRVFHATFGLLPTGLTMPTLTTIFDVMWLAQPAWVRPRGAWARFAETPFMQHGMRRALRFSSRLAAISDATRDAIQELDPAAAERTRVTWSGVGGRFRPASSEAEFRAVAVARQKWLPGAERYVLTVGQFAPYKNHPAVVRAFREAFRDMPHVHLAMVQRRGKGQDELLRLARSLGIGPRLHLLRDVPYGELVALYRGALALCHPSLCEGFGNPPIEAMATGCPVVTSDRSPMREATGGAALLVDPAEDASIAAGLRRIAHDATLAEKLRTRGLARASELSWRNTARATLEIYRELL